VVYLSSSDLAHGAIPVPRHIFAEIGDLLISDLNRSLYQIRVFGQLGIITGLMGVLYAVHFRVIGTNKLEFGSLFPLFYHVTMLPC